MNDEGVQRGAILLLSLGEEGAAEVMKHLAPQEVQKLGQAMAALKSVTRDKIDTVLQAFHSEAELHTTVGVASDEYIRNVLTKAIGDDKAAPLLDRILHGDDISGIDGLKWMDPTSVAEMIRDEHPQIIATILVHLDRNQASEILGHFTERLRNDVMLRIATLDGVQPAALKELNEVLTKLLSGNQNLKKSPMGGARTVAEILNFMNGTLEGSVLESMRAYDADLAQKIQDEMFVFDNLLELDDRSMQLLLTDIPSDSLVIALRGSNEALQDKIFKNMSQRAAEALREEMEVKGPVRVSEVEAKQKEILKAVRRLADEGKIALGVKGEDAYV